MEGSRLKELRSKKAFKAIQNKSGILLGLIILMAFFSIQANNFLSQRNLLNILLQSSISATVALGMTVVITGGGIDLSVGSVMASSSITAASFMAGGMHMALAIVLALLIAVCFGVVNGFIISRTTIAPFSVTLGMQSIARGIVYIICNGVGQFLECLSRFYKIAKDSGDMLPMPEDHAKTSCISQMLCDDGQEYHGEQYNPIEGLLRAEESVFTPWDGDVSLLHLDTERC